ncbi:hypothetical protein TWF718_009207 [Orbilia javanica]|uniref:Uncharacterized protein n=1 Tax=Orbilia javanica TaxID=47235 RepID=A0AAN8RCF2_9PEZI
MHSLASIAPELSDMIIEDFSTEDLFNLRSISKSHDARFKHRYWQEVFNENEITLRATHLQKFLDFLRTASDELKNYLRTITIRCIDSYNEIKDPKVAVLLKKIIGSLTYLENVDFDMRFQSSNAIEHWKLVMNAIIASKCQTIQSINGPHCGLAMSSFNLRESQLISYEDTFQNLVYLEVSTSVQSERADVTFAFWSWVMVVGSNIEDLSVTGYRSQGATLPKPDGEGRFLPKNFNLPKLRALELVNVCLTLKDLKVMLRNTNIIKNIKITGCVAEPNHPSYFFKLLQYLKDNKANHLERLELNLSGYHGQAVGYELPDISLGTDWAGTNWTDPKTIAKVKLNATRPIHVRTPQPTYSCEKSLWQELENNTTTVDFWNSLTDGTWIDKDITMWKKKLWIGGYRIRNSINRGSCEWAKLFRTHSVYYSANDPGWSRTQDQTMLNITKVNKLFLENGVILGEEADGGENDVDEDEDAEEE